MEEKTTVEMTPNERIIAGRAVISEALNKYKLQLTTVLSAPTEQIDEDTKKE